MVAIGAAVGTAVIATIVTKLISFTVGEALKVAKKFSHGDLVKELRHLDLKLRLIKDLLEDAESKQTKSEGVRALLLVLKDAAYDAEDVLDEYATDTALLLRRKRHVRKWIKGKRATPEVDVLDNYATDAEIRRKWQPMKWIKGKHNQLGLTKEIKSINNRFERVRKEMESLGLQQREMPDRGNSISARGRQSASLLDVDWPIIGRDDEKNEIIELLRSNEAESNKSRLPVLPIVGMGGVGKTSLAQLVFHDKSLKTHFPLRIWVFVSQDFDPCKILRSIIESIYADSGEGKTCYSTSLESLQNETRKLIEKGKFLLILDDVWNEEQCLWKQLLTPLKLGKNGSKVLVTTRSQTVVKSIYGHMNPVNLESMDNDHIWEILARGAFKGVADPVDDENLRNIGRQIVEKLKGSPLAAKTIGRLLGTNLHKNHWEMILKSDLWEVRGQKEDDIMPSLWLSYQYLPPILKKCFSLCSLFPKGRWIPKEKLSYIWIAHGIFPLEHNMTPENSAAEAIQDLISMSLLSQSTYDDKFVTMHDLIHDVSKFVSREDHLQINDNIVPEKHPPKLRHLSFSNMNWVSFSKTNWESKLSCDKLRSVLCTDDYLSFHGVYFNIGWLNQYKWLRVLDLRGYHFQVLPNSIGKLKHLRYLNLSRTNISELPKSLTSLYNLRALWLESCTSLRKLPDGMGNLVNLSLLSLKGCKLEKLPDGIENLVNLRILKFDERLECTIKDIGRFSSLQELSCFDVDPQNGRGIEILENLPMLRGELAIRSLENVVDVVKARKASLQRKEYLQGLTFQWTEDCVVSSETAEELLEALQPNVDRLKYLEIVNYKGMVLPRWLTQGGHLPACRGLQSLPSGMRELSNLQTLRLHKCHQMQSLPDMTLPASLRQLRIVDCESLTSLPSDITRLTSLLGLTLWNCPKIESLADIGLPASLQDLKIGYCESLTSLPSDMTQLTSLRSLELRNCCKIESLADIGLPASLQQLSINDCESFASLPSDMTRFTSLRTLLLDNCPRLQSFPESGLPPSLSTLEIRDCQGLQSFPEPGFPPSLSVLRMINCPGLQSFSESGLPPSLSTLRMINCPGLQSFPKSGLPPSLSTLEIRDCQGLQSFPESGLPPSLSTLDIINCSGLQSFPKSGLPPLLTSLYIEGCPGLQSFPESGLPPLLTSLRIKHCQGLQSFPKSSLPPLLTSLFIEGCPGLQSFLESGLPPSLSTLTLINFPGLQSFPKSGLPPLLRALYIEGCPGLQSFPELGLPPSLSTLLIIDCPALKKKYRNRPERTMLSHIPFVYWS